MSRAFSPDSLAVVGASSDPDRIAGRPIRYLQQHGYEGEIYPVNPSHDEVAGLTCYPDVESLPTTPDLAVVILPAELVVDVVEDCAEVGVETVLIVSSGFAETGDESSVEAEARLTEIAETTGTRIIGPNSQGLINFPESVTASFTPALEREELLSGPVSFVTQSGAFGGALTTILQNAEIGLNKWVSTGNEADMESLDFASLFADDDTTGLVASYLEGFEDGRKLIELKRTDAGIELPIVVLKGGRSERGKTAAASHTGKIAGRKAVYDAVFSETGLMEVDDIDLFAKVTESLTRLETYPGPRIGVVSTSGGAGIHIADVVAEERGIELPDLSEATRERLGEHIPAYGATLNPVDITGQVVNSPETFRECMRLLVEADELDTVLLQITNASGENAADYAEDVAEIATDADTPVFVSWTGGVDKDRALEIYDEAGIPAFENPARCVRTIAAIARFAGSREPLRAARELPARPPEHDGGDAPALLSETDAKALLADHGVSIPDARLVDSATEAVEAAEAIGYPVAAKLISPDVQHRDRIGGIRLELTAPEDVEAAYDELTAVAEAEGVALQGVSIQRQVPEGLELGAGIVTGTDFGPVVMLGRGGVDIEAVRDVTFRTIPVGEAQAERMLGELETVDDGELTDAAREAVVDAVVALSEIYRENPWIAEADVNPLIVSESGATAVDALFVGPDE